MKKQAYNPYLPLNAYIPDAEPHVFGDRVYIYGSHDAEGGVRFCMLDYECWSAPVEDLSNWRCEGIIYQAEQCLHYSKERQDMYAPDAVQGPDGRYYLYYDLAGGGNHGFDGPISVAVCDTPAGKYEYYGDVRYPDHGFEYRGVIVSNGDIGINGRTEKERLCATGTNHGSIEKINGKYYIFYHRQKHNTAFSRQACA